LPGIRQNWINGQSSSAVRSQIKTVKLYLQAIFSPPGPSSMAARWCGSPSPLLDLKGSRRQKKNTIKNKISNIDATNSRTRLNRSLSSIIKLARIPCNVNLTSVFHIYHSTLFDQMHHLLTVEHPKLATFQECSNIHKKTI
jgi:hypothetical protein